MSTQMDVSVGEAGDFIEAYFEKYPKINEYIFNTISDAKKKKYVSTLLNRRRYLPEIESSNSRVRAAAERAAINMPIQGTAADMIKIAMIKIHHELKKAQFNAKMILQIHPLL